MPDFKKRLIYLATPYSHPSYEVQQQRFELACQIAAQLLNQGHLVLSPIAHGHAIAINGGFATDWRRWKLVDSELLQRCDVLWVVRMSGWDKSKGIRAELTLATELGKPIYYLCPDLFELSPHPCAIPVGG